GGHERALQAQGDESGDRGDVDDAARAPGPHRAGCEPADLVEARQVDGQQAVPLLPRELVDGPAVGEGIDTGGAGPDVKPAEGGNDLVDNALALLTGGDVQAPRRGARHVRGGIAGSRLVHVGVDNRAAVGGQPVGDRPADPAPGTGDEANLV